MNNVDVGWGMISACNMKCKFCYSSNVRTEICRQDKGLKDWIYFVDRNHEAMDSINYGTGENSLSKDWFKFVEYVSANYPHIKQAITTNGTLFEKIKCDEKLESIINKGISEIDVSLDFADAGKHDDLRGLSGAYNNAVQMLHYCKDTEIEATLVFLGAEEVLQIDNLKKLFDIAQREECKLRTNIYRPMDIHDPKTSRFIAKYHTILHALKWIDENHQIFHIGDPLFSSIYTDAEPTEDPSGSKSVRILSNGDITPSTYLIEKNFRNLNIEEALLKDINGAEMGINFELPEDCRSCQFASTCRGGVLDRRFLWYHTFDARDPYCPFREGNGLPEGKVKINPNHVKMQSVHKDYLPTMFFGV